jgi:hypothetical protein
VGGPVAFIYKVTNTGDQALTKVSVIDDRRGDISGNFPDTLNPSESFEKIRVYTVKESDPRPFTNSATASYSPAAAVTDSCTVDVPHLTLTKTAVSKADSTTYTITLKNDGSTLLSRIYVRDSRLGDISGDFPELMAPGQEAVRQFTREPAEPCDNVAEAFYQSFRELVYARAECTTDLLSFLSVVQIDTRTGQPFDEAPLTFHICQGAVALCDAGNANITTQDNPFGPVQVDPDTYTACVVEPAGFETDADCKQANVPEGGSATITFFTSPIPTDGEACTPGFWRNIRQRLDEWHVAGYDPADDFSLIFGFDNVDTLGDAVNARGGQLNKLLRFSVASLLASGHPDVNFALTEGEVKAMALAAYNAEDWNVFDGFFDDEDCPL